MEYTPPDNPKNWTTFTYYSPAIRKITNLFINSTLGIAFKSKNTIFKQITMKKHELINPSGIYGIKCNTCNKTYIGQTGRGINIRHKEHIRYIKTNNPQSAYAMHILNNRHEYGPAKETLQLLRPCSKESQMNSWEAMIIQLHHHRKTLITEQQPYEHNILYDCMQAPRSQTLYVSTETTLLTAGTSTEQTGIT